MTLKEKLEQRAGLVKEAREIHAVADKEQRNLTSEDQKKFDELMDAADKLKSEVDQATANEERSRRLEDAEKALERSSGRRTSPTSPEGESRSQSGDVEYRKAYEKYIRRGGENLEYEEKRALSAGTATEGGYLVPPEQRGPFIQKIDDLVFMRQLGTVIQVDGADSLGSPSLDADPADSTWTAELQTGSEDSTMAFGKRILKPHPYAKRLKMSRDLLAKAANAESLAMARLQYKCAITEEKGFLTGTGVQCPLGVFVANSDGISTSRDLSTGNTSSAIVADNLIANFYNVKAGYRKNAKWLFHRDAIKMIRQLKFSIGSDSVAYVWEPSIKAGEQDTILGRPVLESEYAPNTFTTGLYVGLFGDFSYYWIADGSNLSIQRLNELYAETNQVGLIVRRHVDGQPVMGEAFSRVKLG